MKKFNTTGICYPERHYMVDITERLTRIKGMIDEGDYFCINRGRQYGKTTTLHAIETSYKEELTVLSMSFEGKGEETFSKVESVYADFVYQIWMMVEFEVLTDLSDDIKTLISEAYAKADGSNALSEKDFCLFVRKLCLKHSKPVVVLIDEVDQAGNYQGFLQFLGTLRKMYLERSKFPTFQSVILAGVYDIKNLKLKVRDESEHQYNSPWNIAAKYDEDMSLHADGIRGMLDDYESEHHVGMDTRALANMIYDYTSGYPFLVSRLCQIIDTQSYAWNKEGLLQAVNDLLKESNTLFDDIVKKLDQFPQLELLIKEILYTGKKKSYSPDEKYLQLAMHFNFLKEVDGCVAIACRIIETRLYNTFIAKEFNSPSYSQGQIDKNQFVHDGIIDLRHLIERFSIHFNDIYRPGKDNKFVEDNGRKIFLTYLRPIINGIGNYYCEAETRDETRTDVIIDYLGQQYIIELKIWRGNSYNERGEQQLKEYLDRYHLNTGYLVSFCFNKNKQPGVHEVCLDGKKLVECIV